MLETAAHDSHFCEQGAAFSKVPRKILGKLLILLLLLAYYYYYYYYTVSY